jgi:hypothetical protein
MKSIAWTIALLIFLPFSLPAQTTTVWDDFEGNGTITTWVGDDCVIDTDLANPFPEGMNTSSTVLAYQDEGGTVRQCAF